MVTRLCKKERRPMKIAQVVRTIDSVIEQLGALKGSLDIFNENGLKIVYNNINDIQCDLAYATLEKK